MELPGLLNFLTSWYLFIGEGPVPYLYTTASESNPSSTSLFVHPILPSTAAVPTVNPSFPALAFEERSFVYYAGTKDHENEFSKNLVAEVARRTNTRPVIRVGGTSLDSSKFNETQTKPFIIPSSEAQENVPQNLSIGPSYFQSFATFSNALYIPTIPLASNDLANSLEFAKVAYSAVGAENILELEIGNEPNNYETQGENSSSWTPDAYIGRWQSFTTAVSKELGIPVSAPTYQALGLAFDPGPIPTNVAGPRWNVRALFDDGLDRLLDRIASVSIHYYQIVATSKSNLQRDLMNHTVIKSRLDYFLPTMKILKKKGLALNLGEVGSALNPVSNNFLLESVFGSALWQLDFMLYAMSIGVNRVNLQQGIGFAFAMWQPVDYHGRLAEVAPPYYAQIVAADFIGDQYTVQVMNIKISSDMLSAYAAYDGNTGGLVKVALVNLQFWSREYSDPYSARPYVNASINVPKAAQKVSVSYLSSPLGATAANPSQVTWDGRSWTFASRGLGVSSKITKNDTVHLLSQNGLVTVKLDASSAAIVRFD